MRRMYVLLALGLAACGSSSKHSAPAGTTGTTTNPNGTTVTNPNGVSTPTAGNGNAINPNDPTKTYTGPTVVKQGRMVTVSDSNVQFNWAGSSFTCRPAAASVSLGIMIPDATTTSSQMMDVYIDGVAQTTPVTLTHGTTSYSVTLPDTKPHIVSWVLRTEANYGTGNIVYTGITATGGSLLPTETPAASPRQIEFIGDSITNGYGAMSASHNPVLNANNGCSVSGSYTSYVQDSSTENADLSYATLTAQHFGAAYNLVASSGRGVYRNGGTTADPNGLNTPNMSNLYGYTLHPYSANISGTTITGIPAWDATAAAGATWSPQAVVINLGTNDFANHGTTADPNANPVDTSAFTTAYKNLLTSVHTLYPTAKIFPLVGPMLTTATKSVCITAINAAITAANLDTTVVPEVVDAGVQDITNTGCEYHPLPAEQASVSATLVPSIQAALNW